MKAIAENNLDEAQRLLCSGANIFIKDNFNEDALVYAIKTRNRTICELLLQNTNILKMEGKETFKYLELIHEHNMQDLIDINAPIDGYGNTLLMREVNEKQIEHILILLRFEKIDLNRSNINNETALTIAARLNSLNVVNGLIHTGNVDVDHATSYGSDALFFAFANKNIDMIERILNAGGGNIQHETAKNYIRELVRSDESILLTSIARNYSNTISFILGLAPELKNAKIEDGKTFLMHAIEKKREDAVRTILKFSPDVSITNGAGKSAKQLLEESGYDKLLDENRKRELDAPSNFTSKRSNKDSVDRSEK